jgi:protein-L-isoaspartate O-methyltransferase
MNNYKKIIEEILGIHENLKHEKDLSPNNEVINKNLTRLVSICTENLDFYDTHMILKDKRIQKTSKNLLNICKRSEGEMEKYWVKHFLNIDNLSYDCLKKFIYFKNYLDLVKDEVPLARVKETDKVLFVGSGALPLTSIIMSKVTGCKSYCFDIDKEACDLSKKLVEKIGLDNSVFIINKDGRDADLSEFNVIIIASLVEAKRELTSKIVKENISGRVVIRSAEGIRILLYDKVKNEELKGLIIKKRVEPTVSTINTPLLVCPA